MRSAGITLLLGVALVACQPQLAADSTPPIPTPFPEIATTPGFQPWVVSSILQFREQQASEAFSGFGLEVLAPSAALESVEQRQHRLVVSSAEPPADWFVTPLGWEGVVLAVNRANRVPDLQTEQIISIFSGRVSNWETLGGSSGPIEPIIPLRGDELREYLGGLLLDGLPFTPAALLGPSPELMLSLIAERTGAIGILPLSAATSEVRLIRISGVTPSASTIQSGEYPLRVEILGYAPQEPEGAIRDWLVWIQSGQP